MKTTLYALCVLVSLAVLWSQWVGLNYDDCTIKHRSGYFLLTPREPIHEACQKRLSPFYR